MANVEKHSVLKQTALLQSLRWRLLRNRGSELLRHSWLRALTIVLCCAFIWLTLFVVGYFGFLELRYRFKVFLDDKLILWIFDLTFVALSVLLVFSTGIILYSSLFKSQESSFLLVTPISADQIFAYKYQGALAFSSWAFLLLGSPLFVAYGIVIDHGAPWYYYALLPLYFAGFVFIPGSLGALACLGLVIFFPRRRKQLVCLFGFLFLASALWWLYAHLLPSTRNLLRDGNALTEMLASFSLLQSPFLPAQWMAEGFRAAASREPIVALYYLALIWSNGLVLYLATAWAAKKLYRRGHNSIASGFNTRRKYSASWMDSAFSRVVAFLDDKTRTLIEKDFRNFRRDPAQWVQIVIFVVLAVLYFTNVRSFYQHAIGQRFRNGISLLNLTATGFLMCAYTGRFVFPMLSLEGRKFWILGLLPLDRRSLLWGKFYFSAIATVLTGEFLVILSNVMLNMPWEFVVLHVIAIAGLALGLSGLSVGMGATMPNFKETDPSKIAVGFGGTMTLIMGLIFQLALTGVMVLPWHLMLAFRGSEMLKWGLAHPWLWFLMAAGILLSVAAVMIPMRAGVKALLRMEF